MTEQDLKDAILRWCETHRAVAHANTRAKFLEASADLWEAERALESLGVRLELLARGETPR